MSGLSELRLQVRYRSDAGNLVRDFYVPCMSRARIYRRAVGYFTSHGLAIAAQGIAHLIHGGGRIQLVASPALSEDDIAAISRGYESKQAVVERAAAQALESVTDAIIRDRLSAIAWLISIGRLEIKLAVRLDAQGRPVRGIYHEKIGIFSDDDAAHVAFSGSPNETIGGLIDNFESIDVFWSWEDPQSRVATKLRDFELLWSERTPGLEVMEFPKAPRALLEAFKTKEPPDRDPLELSGLTFGIGGRGSGVPVVPVDPPLMDHQKTAIRSWFANNGRGTLKMATGSGKTITALAIASELHQKASLQALIVVCPYRHLVTQWDKEARRFGLNPILAFESRSRWADHLSSAIYGAGSAKGQFVSVITTNSTFSSDTFQGQLRHFPANTLIVGDEAHNLGATRLLEVLPDGVKLRLALSATPERWFDDRGTAALFSYFGPVLEPQFTLKDALEAKVLVPYRYYPILVELTESEAKEYLDLSEKIAKVLMHKDLDEDNPALTALLMKRARLVGVAANKLVELRALMRDRMQTSHTLFYCGDGSVEDEATAETRRQVEEVCRVLGHELGYRVSSYTFETPVDEREELRIRFDSGELQGLVAIRCLDEGVDIPAIRTAVILASSSNARQFIQRRGRILRRAAGKKGAEIFDMLVTPPEGVSITGPERSLMRKELARVAEFAGLAANSGEARAKILGIQNRFGLLDI